MVYRWYDITPQWRMLVAAGDLWRLSVAGITPCAGLEILIPEPVPIRTTTPPASSLVHGPPFPSSYALVNPPTV